VARAHHSHGEGAAISPAVARRRHGTPPAESRSVSGMAAVARRGEGMVLRRRKRGATCPVWPRREPSSSASRSNVNRYVIYLFPRSSRSDDLQLSDCPQCNTNLVACIALLFFLPSHGCSSPGLALVQGMYKLLHSFLQTI
jgi:hypothetical protein